MRVWRFLLLVASIVSAAEKPIVIAHRGGAALRPENTIAAFHHAVTLGVDMLEFDMNVTADNRIVIHHDSTVNAEVCRPSAGSQVKPGPIHLLTLNDILRFDCGSSQRPNSPNYKTSPAQKMPTLDLFLSAVKASNLPLLGETKMPPAGTESVTPEKFVELIDTIVRKHNVEDRFILQSSDYRTTDAMRKRNPKIKICLLNARRFKPGYMDLARRHGATHLMLRADDATADEIRQLQSAGIKILSGTANSADQWKKYVELGMDGILTDDPLALMQFLGRKTGK